MKTGKQKNLKKSIPNQMKRIFLIAVLLVAVDVCISLAVIRDTKKQDSHYLSNMAQLYIQEQNETFFKLSRKLLSILMGNEGTKLDINDALSVLETSGDPLALNIATARLQKPLENLNFTEYGFCVLTDGENRPVTDITQREELVNRYLQTGTFSPWFVIEKSFDRAPFYVLIFIENMGTYGKFFATQAALQGLRQAAERMQHVVVSLSPDKRGCVKAYLVAVRGMELIQKLGIVLSAREYKTAMLIPVDAVRLAGELEEWFYFYKEIWRSVSRESELYRLQDVVNWYADYLRG